MINRLWIWLNSRQDLTKYLRLAYRTTKFLTERSTALTSPDVPLEDVVVLILLDIEWWETGEIPVAEITIFTVPRVASVPEEIIVKLIMVVSTNVINFVN